MAGVSVAAVAVPTAIAYAQLIGFEPIVGLYAAILPLVAYALFGTSRQLIVNPDAATCAIFAATVLPLAGGDADALRSLSMALAVLTGLLCIAAGIFRLGFLADFLGKPILVGYLNGVAISIFLGQIGKVFGFSMQSRGITPRLIEFAGKLHYASADAYGGIDDPRSHHGEQTPVASSAGAVAGDRGGPSAGLRPRPRG